jgi:tRNA (adenine22-N1)-methyltransferase
MITDRLLAISRMVIKGQVAADIGSDHARLPLYLAEQGLVPGVIATEINEGPLFKAREAIAASSARDLVELRPGDGLQPLIRGEAVTVIIAGLGGDTICRILSSDWEKAASFRYFVFQPMSRPYMLRAALAERGWPILDEVLVMENKRIFVIISSKPGEEPYQLSRLELDIGPIILQRREQYLEQLYLQHWMAKYRAVYQGLVQSDILLHRTSIMDYQERIKALEVIIDAGKSSRPD